MMGINFCVELGDLGVSMFSDHYDIDLDRGSLKSCPCRDMKIKG